MNLSDYLKTLSRDLLEDFAKRVGTTPAHLKQVAGGHRRAGEYLCINIDRETSGLVNCELLRPDVDWAYIRSTGTAEQAA
jgi:DNA-binding transcriptional regulator YdaS (Cro superfamily)